MYQIEYIIVGARHGNVPSWEPRWIIVQNKKYNTIKAAQEAVKCLNKKWHPRWHPTCLPSILKYYGKLYRIKT